MKQFHSICKFVLGADRELNFTNAATQIGNGKVIVRRSICLSSQPVGAEEEFLRSYCGADCLPHQLEESWVDSVCLKNHIYMGNAERRLDFLVDFESSSGRITFAH